jgi:signal transduction histidine kinase
VLPAGPGTLGHVALAAEQPLVARDLARETRFEVPVLFREHGLASGAVAVVVGPERPFGLVGALSTRRRALSRDEVDFLRAAAGVLALAVARGRAEAERDEALAREHAVRAQAGELATHRERARLAGELHDTLSQILFSVGLKLDWCLARLSPDSELAVKLEEIRQETGFMMAQIRKLISRLSVEAAEGLTCAERLRRLVVEFRALTGVAAELSVTGEPGRLDPRREEIVQKTFQEALANVAKHARATRVDIRLAVGPDEAAFEVGDDGVGLPVGTDAAALLGGAGHFGLRQMVQRIEAVGGRLVLGPNGTRGVRLSGAVPVIEETA